MERCNDCGFLLNVQKRCHCPVPRKTTRETLTANDWIRSGAPIPKADVLCRACGHPRGEHAEEPPYECMNADMCDCREFSYVLRQHPLLERISTPEEFEAAAWMMVEMEIAAGRELMLWELEGVV